MAAHIPLALSLLQAVASQYPGLSQKSAPVPPVSIATQQPQQPQQAPPAPPVQSSAAPIPVSGSTNPGNALCDACHARPKYVEGRVTHPYCSRTCAAQGKGTTSSTPPSKPNANSKTGMCERCHQRPKYYDGSQLLSYCSKSCAGAAKPSAPTGKPPVVTGKPPVVTGSQPSKKRSTSAAPPKQRSTATCKAPNCTKPPYVDGNGTKAEYCSIAHRSLGQSICLLCLKKPRETKSHFCGSKCQNDAEKQGPLLLEVPTGHVTFTDVAEQFKAAWRHPSACPTVKHVYKVIGSKKSITAYNAYQASVEARGHFQASGRSSGNENRRFHGTKRECHLGDPGLTLFCSSPTCSLCSILKTSFDIGVFGKKTKWGRFGRGIYTSSTASKANDYSSNSASSPLKAVILAKVIVGRGCKVTQNSPSLLAPPTGYDSVLGETGGSLNWDETVIYDNDGIRPSYLIMYG